MAATTPEEDYVHLLSDSISEKYNRDVNLTCCNFAIWETGSHDRGQQLSMLDYYLNVDNDIIIIQLGENISNIDTLEADFSEMIKFVYTRNNSPHIVIIGNFWQNSHIDNIKEKIASNYDVDFVSLEDIQGKAEYMSEIGIQIYGEDNKWHISEHAGVAAHPGNSGMKKIAEKIYETLEK